MLSQLRIGVVGVYHETNTFAPVQTHWNDFQHCFTLGRDAFIDLFEHTRTTMGGVITASAEEKVTLVPGLYTSATPSGIVSEEAAGLILEQLTRSIASDLDGMVVILHGAMVSEHCFDMETAILEAIRSDIGAQIPIAVTVDLHANLGEKMSRLCDFLVGYDTYPHIDAYERGEDALHLLVRQIRGEIEPVMAIARPNMLVAPQKMITTKGIMKAIMEEAFDMEKDPEVLNVTVCGGFPYSDVPFAGMAFAVTTNRNEALANYYAKKLADLAWAHRDEFLVQQVDAEQAIRLAMDAKEGPILLVEASDNVGGGAPADGTHLLPELLKLPLRSLIVIRDREAVSIACERGVGSEISCAIGGKSDTLHGNPVEIEGKIKLLFDGKYTHRGPYMKGAVAYMGKTAVIDTNQVTIVLTEERVPPWDIGHVESIGLNPQDFHLIVVKSAVAWISAFGPIAKQVIEVDTPGCCTPSLHRLTYHHVPRSVFPFHFPEKEHAQ
ncbi:M81 family metallopeptidase [Paenibacillus chondroitinus]|uniref:M81 family metallopeptidase n=1 Tax=Paenibacillus chondroitinus TaxID=59842 RepID=A0ABU6DFB5_9BACL|nr:MULTISPECIES: M81 family metallopeptidase [Paenibacillus]MCY9659214.1 M81 family metallopeptidase [Paenibacillus anseongense]MEB4796451.1 M81 family metallopeptidase [Paenibacillus chondroitinus]